MENPLSAVGAALGVAGALLDFGAGYYLLSRSLAVEGPMGAMTGLSPSGFGWGLGLVLFGLVVLLTAILAGVGSHVRMAAEGRLMVLYGAAMVFIGAAMLSGFAPMMMGNSLSGFAMVGVGALMAANGVLMSRSAM